MKETEKTEEQVSDFMDLFQLDFNKFETTKTDAKVEEKTEDGSKEEGTKKDIATTEKIDDTIIDIVDTTKNTPAEESLGELESLIENISDVLYVNEDKEYEDSLEGLKQIIIDTKENAKKEALQEFKTTLGDKEKSLFDTILNGGTVDEFLVKSQKVDFSKVPLEDSKGEPILQNQRSLVEDWLLTQGLEKEEIDERLADLQTAGLLEKEAKLAKRKLADLQIKEEEDSIKQREDAKKLADIEAKKQAEEFKNKVLSTQEIAGFKLNKEEATKLYDYITKPVNKKGETKFMQDDNDEARLLYAYFAMSGFDKEKLSREIVTKKTISLKKVLSNYQDQNAKGKTAGDMRRSTDETPKIYWPDMGN